MALGPFYVAEKLTQSGGIRGVALLMRHGETPWNREGRVMGKNPIELDEDGRRQVELAIPLSIPVGSDVKNANAIRPAAVDRLVSRCCRKSARRF